MKKRDRPSRYGGTIGQVAKRGWWNWHFSRGRLSHEPGWFRQQQLRSMSWRRTL